MQFSHGQFNFGRQLVEHLNNLAVSSLNKHFVLNLALKFNLLQAGMQQSIRLKYVYTLN